MKVIGTALPGVVIIEPKVFGDDRGFFLETYHQQRYAAAGIPEQFVQDNHSRSVPGTLRGLHYQRERPQGKLVRCVRGAIFDVAVDIRRGSPTFGKWVGVELSEDNKRQLYIPHGFAHGFCVPAVVSEMEYKCTDFYHPEDESGVIWNDPAIGIAWPIRNPVLSQKDAGFPPLTPERRDLPPYPE
ncbi:MAG TPA: dTDP-4-dehydrorhamnose 3,5-epimerase [Gemmatimonadales bacterium]|nr:dTDP-4-dehydrorhamnose 3,5-epimerase [Gemmatimonadales bacterium]